MSYYSLSAINGVIHSGWLYSKKEIPLSPRWTIGAYQRPNGRRVFVEEYASQSTAVKAEFRAVLNELRHQDGIDGWCRPNGFDRLSGEYRALGKLRFKVLNVQHRPLGFFGPFPDTFTLLAWATERDKKY